MFAEIPWRQLPNGQAMRQRRLPDPALQRDLSQWQLRPELQMYKRYLRAAGLQPNLSGRHLFFGQALLGWQLRGLPVQQHVSPGAMRQWQPNLHQRHMRHAYLQHHIPGRQLPLAADLQYGRVHHAAVQHQCAKRQLPGA